jgi:hypothetical protein
MPLAVAQEVMFRLERAYPAYWEPAGLAGHCPYKVEFVARDGRTLATSDYGSREMFLTQVCAKRSPRVAAHWQFLLQPLVAYHSDLPGTLRYKQLEYYGVPQMAFLAVDPGVELTRADDVRLAFASGPGDCAELPFSQRHLPRLFELADGNFREPGTKDANVVQQGYFTAALTRVILPKFKKNEKPFVIVFWSRDPDDTQHN